MAATGSAYGAVDDVLVYNKTNNHQPILMVRKISHFEIETEEQTGYSAKSMNFVQTFFNQILYHSFWKMTYNYFFNKKYIHRKFNTFALAILDRL